MKMLKGKKTYLIAIIAAIYQVAYQQGMIPIDAEMHATILALLGSGALVAVRQGITASGPAEKPKPGADGP
jgi:hypothetical protein